MLSAVLPSFRGLQYEQVCVRLWPGLFEYSASFPNIDMVLVYFVVLTSPDMGSIPDIFAS